VRRDAPGVVIQGVRGVAGELPLDPKRNTAGQAVLAMVDALRLDCGFEMQIDKGIALGSGLGGSGRLRRRGGGRRECAPRCAAQPS